MTDGVRAAIIVRLHHDCLRKARGHAALAVVARTC